MDTVDLAIRMTADATDASDAFDKVGSSASAMADDVASAASQADGASRDLAGGVDALGSSSAKAAGGLGDLGGALSAVPGPLGSVGSGMTMLQPLIMGAAGASDLLSLAMERTGLAAAKAKAQSAALAVKTAVLSAAQKAAAAAQWALNVAMNANPLGLLVAAIALLVGGFILAYKKSDTFREAVQKAGDVGKKALGFIVDKAKDIKDKIDAILKPVGGLSGVIETLGTVGETAFNLWLTPLRLLVDLFKQIVEWIGKIKIPDGIGAVIGAVTRVSAGGGDPGFGSVPFSHAPLTPWVVNVRVEGAVDPVSTARQIGGLLRQYGVIQGDVVGA